MTTREKEIDIIRIGWSGWNSPLVGIRKLLETNGSNAKYCMKMILEIPLTSEKREIRIID